MRTKKQCKPRLQLWTDAEISDRMFDFLMKMLTIFLISVCRNMGA